MSGVYISETNSSHQPVFCPKAYHIKPCWCRGEALCAAYVNRRKCKRMTKGAIAYCWQHKPKEER